MGAFRPRDGSRSNGTSDEATVNPPDQIQLQLKDCRHMKMLVEERYRYLVPMSIMKMIIMMKAKSIQRESASDDYTAPAVALPNASGWLCLLRSDWSKVGMKSQRRPPLLEFLYRFLCDQLTVVKFDTL